MSYIKQTIIGLAVMTKNEIELMQDFIPRNNLRDIFSEIVFLDDFSTDGTYEQLLKWQNEGWCYVQQRALNLHFANQRNFLNSLMKSEYIFTFDLDYTMNENLKQWVCNFKPEADLYWNFRRELVDNKQINITRIASIYKNIKSIYWVNELHECIEGATTNRNIPDECHILHNKSTKRCEKQNQFYYSSFEKQRRLVDGDKK